MQPDNKLEFVIEEFWDDISKTNYRMKYAGYVMNIKDCNGHIYMLSIQDAMNRLRKSYELRGFYIPPVQITKIKEMESSNKIYA
jgi:hypothetical protein